RHDVSSVAGQEQASVAHWLCDEGAKRCDGLLQGGPGGDTRRNFRPQPDCQLLPQPIVRPVLELLIDWNLDVVPAPGWRAHRCESESALVICVNQLLVARRHVCQDAEPSEGILELVMPGHGVRYASAGWPVETVTTGNE